MNEFKTGDIVYFRENVKGDCFDKKYKCLFIPNFFEKMVGHQFKIYGIGVNSDNEDILYLEDIDGVLSDYNFDESYPLNSFLFAPYWFDYVCKEMPEQTDIDFF